MATAAKKPTKPRKARETMYGRVEPDYRAEYTMIRYDDYLKMLRAKQAAQEEKK